MSALSPSRLAAGAVLFALCEGAKTKYVKAPAEEIEILLDPTPLPLDATDLSNLGPLDRKHQTLAVEARNTVGMLVVPVATLRKCFDAIGLNDALAAEDARIEAERKAKEQATEQDEAERKREDDAAATRDSPPLDDVDDDHVGYEGFEDHDDHDDDPAMEADDDRAAA